MKPCKEVRELRNEKYQDFLAYIERKILNILTTGFIFIDENEAMEHGVAFSDNRWISLLEEAGYTVKYCSNIATPTVEISGW